MNKWDFSGDVVTVNFCAECGSLLDLPNQIGNIECKLCNYLCPARGMELIIFNLKVVV